MRNPGPRSRRLLALQALIGLAQPFVSIGRGRQGLRRIACALIVLPGAARSPVLAMAPPAPGGWAGTAAAAIRHGARQPIRRRRHRAPMAIPAPGSTPAPAPAQVLPRRSWDRLIRPAPTPRACSSRTRRRASGAPAPAVQMQLRAHKGRPPPAARAKDRRPRRDQLPTPARREPWHQARGRCALNPPRLQRPGRRPRMAPRSYRRRRPQRRGAGGQAASARRAQPSRRVTAVPRRAAASGARSRASAAEPASRRRRPPAPF